MDLDLNSLTPSIEPEHVFQYCTRNIAAPRRHIQFYYKSISFYSAYVYRIEKYCISAKIFNTYRIVRHAYRYTPSHRDRNWESFYNFRVFFQSIGNGTGSLAIGKIAQFWYYLGKVQKSMNFIN